MQCRIFSSRCEWCREESAKTYMILSLDILPLSTCFQPKDLPYWTWPLDAQYPSTDLPPFNLSSLFLNRGKILHPYHPSARSATERLSAVLELFPLICSERGPCQLQLMHPYSCIGWNSEQLITFHPLCVTHHPSVDLLNFSFRHLFYFFQTKESILLT